ncbi:serine hydrolase FSH [Melampsora americana]|nr:serine hydrolase FSH [Melampsora americana]
MVFVDAPHVIDVPTVGTGAFEKFDSTAGSSETDAELIPRAWWSSKEPEQTGLPNKVYEGLDETMTFLREVIDTQGPFDACFGFSQGAALAAVLSSVLESPNLHEAFSSLKDQSDGQKAFKAVVLVAGFKLDLPPEWYGVRPESKSQTLKTRSLHILGRTDTIVGTDRSEALVSAFTNPRVEWHEGSHFVPSKKSWRDFFGDYFRNLNQTDESLIPSPGTTEDNLSNLPKI